MNVTKIEWCDRTWNPVTGCFHSCPYCYARKQAKRFTGFDKTQCPDMAIKAVAHEKHLMFELKEKLQRMTKKGKTVTATYPFNFDPTFHKYRLNNPVEIKKPQNIFVCSMSDLFGDWVPDEWIKEVIEACGKAPQHRYIFLTKNYRRYNELREKEILPLDTNMYFGASVTTEKQLKQACLFWDNIDFLSIEPLMQYLGVDEWFVDVNHKSHWHWVIVGAETGNRKNKIIPEFEWVDDIVYQCKKMKIPLFMKNNLADIWREKPLIQEYPWQKESL
jgi:protein gp37